MSIVMNALTHFIEQFCCRHGRCCHAAVAMVAAGIPGWPEFDGCLTLRYRICGINR